VLVGGVEEVVVTGRVVVVDGRVVVMVEKVVPGLVVEEVVEGCDPPPDAPFHRAGPGIVYEVKPL
jgi:hypothetical protein